MLASCAAVFFVTPSFHDDRYLETEINYAFVQKRESERGKRRPFAIVPVALLWGDRTPEIPEILRPHIVKEASGELEALGEILAALPTRVGTVIWRESGR
jgi:hypothetical protein